jgi:hypothetical protein
MLIRSLLEWAPPERFAQSYPGATSAYLQSRRFVRSIERGDNSTDGDMKPASQADAADCVGDRDRLMQSRSCTTREGSIEIG